MAQQISNATININPDDLKTVTCICGKTIFENVCQAKIVPAIYSPTGKPAVILRPCLRCIECGVVSAVDEIEKL